jgi:recombination protein RecA
MTEVITQDKISAIIEKKYKTKDIYVPGQLVANEDRVVVSLSPKLDIILNGGIPEGCWVTLTGKPKCGKTTLALHYAAKCQRPEYGGREIYYLDIERRLKKMNLTGIPGLDLNKFHVIRSTKENILSAQDFLGIGEDILRNVPRCVLIVDSYSALSHANEQQAEIGTPVLGMGAYQLLAQFCRQMSAVVPVMDSNIVGITHIMANIGAFGNAAKTTEKGGNAIVYQGDIKLKAKFHVPWKHGEKQIGQTVTWQCEFSALGAPGQEIESYIRYGYGIDELYELIMCGTDLGLITNKASWYTLDFAPKKDKIQGGENIHGFLTQNPELAKLLHTKVIEIFK